jgi:hypothetical protein
MADAPVVSDELRDKLLLVADSFQRLTGKPLVDDPSPEALWHAPRVIVAHGTEADPVFFYGNHMALDVFAMDFASFTRLPSRYSAEPVNREERARLLERVTRDGFIDDYSGVRISATGQRFRIAQAVVWNLVAADGRFYGQAATFDQWTVL